MKKNESRKIKNKEGSKTRHKNMKAKLRKKTFENKHWDRKEKLKGNKEEEEEKKNEKTKEYEDKDEKN